MNHNENYTHDSIEGSSLADEGEFGLFLNEWGQHTGKDDVESPTQEADYPSQIASVTDLLSPVQANDASITTRNPSEVAALVNDENGEISFDLTDIFKRILERTDELKDE